MRATTLTVLLLAAAVRSAGAEDPPPASEPASDLDKLPVLQTFVAAPYPEQAKAEGLEATVVLLIDIDAEGQVEGVAVLEPGPPGYGFDEAAVAAAQQFVFEPAEAGGVAVPVQLTYRYRFILETPPAEVAPPPPPVENFAGLLLERGTRTPLPGVRVTVFRGEGEEARGFEAFSDRDGRFAFFDLEPGAWRVLAEPDGFFPLRTSEELVAGEKTEATYFIERVSQNPYDVLVEAVRPRKEVSRTTLATREIEKIPGAAGDPLAVVQNLPSVARVPTGSGDVIVRGSAPEDTRIFADGVEIPVAFHFGGLRSVVPAGLLEAIDFYPGNFSAYYGRATGGILDLRSVRLAPEDLGGYVDVSLLDTSLFLEAPVGPDAAIAFGARRSYIDGVLALAVPDDVPVGFVTAPRYYDGQLLFSWRPAPAHSVTALIFGSDDQVKLAFDNAGETNPQAVFSRLQARSSFYRSILTWRYAPSERFENELRLSAGRNWLGFSTNGGFLFDLNFYTNQTRNTVRWQLHDRLTLRAGLDVFFNLADTEIRLPRGGSKEGDPAAVGDARQLFSVRSEGELFLSPAAFVEAELTPGAGLTVIPGLRVDHFGRLGETTLDPRLTVRWALAEQWTAKGGVGLFHQEPFFDETDATFGNPALGPEAAWHYSLGAEYRPLPFLSADATLFYKDLRALVSRTDRVVERDGQLVPLLYDNRGRGRVYGAELLVRHELSRNFFGWLSYSLSRAERRDSGSRSWRLFDFDQTHILTLLGTYRLPENWEVGARWRLVSGNLTTPVVGAVLNADTDTYEPIPGRVNSERVGAFHQLDLRVDKRWIYESWILGVYLDLQNVYNRANPEGVQYNYDYSQSEAQQGLPLLAIFGLRAEF